MTYGPQGGSVTGGLAVVGFVRGGSGGGYGDGPGTGVRGGGMG